jgi:hypothetical protein
MNHKERHMTRLSSIALNLLLALAMLCGACRAQASPIAMPAWHVTIDTAALAGSSGYLDFLLLGLGDAQPMQASIRNFTGDYGADSVLAGDARGSVLDGVAIGNGTGWNEFAQWVDFGGIFTFDVSFSSHDGPGAGTNLGIALLDADFRYLGTAGDVMTFALQPGAVPVVTVEPGTAAVAAVPEPGTLLQVATGLLLLAAVTRRGGRHLRRPRTTPTS